MSDANLRIFCAALQGYIAHHGAGPGSSTKEAIDYARACVREAYNNDSSRSEPLLS